MGFTPGAGCTKFFDEYTRAKHITLEEGTEYFVWCALFKSYEGAGIRIKPNTVRGYMHKASVRRADETYSVESTPEKNMMPTDTNALAIRSFAHLPRNKPPPALGHEWRHRVTQRASNFTTVLRPHRLELSLCPEHLQQDIDLLLSRPPSERHALSRTRSPQRRSTHVRCRSRTARIAGGTRARRITYRPPRIYPQSRFVNRR